MDDLPTWYKHIEFQKNNRYITNGLTIPYLIGINKLFNQNMKRPVKSLINNIIESDLDKCAVLQKCPEIGHYVIGIDNRQFCERFMKGGTFFKNSKGNSSLVITLNANKIGDNIEQIIKELEILYSKPINDECFSWNKNSKKWEIFRRLEIEKINEV